MCSGKVAIRGKAISGQTWKSQMWQGTAVTENRLGRAGICWTTRAEVPAELEVKPILRTGRSTFAGVLYPLGVADVCALAVAALAPGPWHSGCPAACHTIPAAGTWRTGDPQRVYNIFQFLMIPEGQCKALMPGRSKALRLVPGTGQGNESIRHCLAARGAQPAPRIWHTAH